MFYYKELRKDTGALKSITESIEEVKSDRYIEITEEEYLAIRKEYKLPNRRGLGDYSDKEKENASSGK